jgi:hypothetical protein
MNGGRSLKRLLMTFLSLILPLFSSWIITFRHLWLRWALITSSLLWWLQDYPRRIKWTRTMWSMRWLIQKSRMCCRDVWDWIAERTLSCQEERMSLQGIIQLTFPRSSGKGNPHICLSSRTFQASPTLRTRRQRLSIRTWCSQVCLIQFEHRWTQLWLRIRSSIYLTQVWRSD